MSAVAAAKEVLLGFKSLLVGMRITLGQFFSPKITVQYPRETLKMPERFRGHIRLVLDPETGASRCTACKLCERACPSECISVDGVKLEGAKTKSVTEYHLNFTTCSLCGLCVEACPFDAIEFSKTYNAIGVSRSEFDNMDMVRQLAGRREVWLQNHPLPPAAPAMPAATAAPAKSAAPTLPPTPETKTP